MRFCDHEAPVHASRPAGCASLPAAKPQGFAVQLEYVDLFLIHWPLEFQRGTGVPLKEGAFLTLAGDRTDSSGSSFARAIGVSNFCSKELESLLEYAAIKPAFDQLPYKHTHPLRGVYVISKSINADRIAENYGMWDRKLSEEDVERFSETKPRLECQ